MTRHKSPLVAHVLLMTFALDSALVTDRKLWPVAMVEKLKPILARFLGE